MAKREMDNLSRDMVKCKADGYGCHYGKWKAMQDPVKIVKKDELPEGWRICEYCGKPYKPTSKRAQKFCEPFCQKQQYYEQHRGKLAAYRQKYYEQHRGKLAAYRQKYNERNTEVSNGQAETVRA